MSEYTLPFDNELSKIQLAHPLINQEDFVWLYTVNQLILNDWYLEKAVIQADAVKQAYKERMFTLPKAQNGVAP